MLWGPLLGLSLADGWAFKNNVVIRNHRNLQDRLQAAQLLLDRSPRCPVVADSMENQSSQLYAALPDRLYVLQEGRILYKVVTTPTPTPRQGPREGKGRKEASHQNQQTWIQTAAQPFTSHVTMDRSFLFWELPFLLQNEVVGSHVSGDGMMHREVPSI